VGHTGIHAWGNRVRRQFFGGGALVVEPRIPTAKDYVVFVIIPWSVYPSSPLYVGSVKVLRGRNGQPKDGPSLRASDYNID